MGDASGLQVGAGEQVSGKSGEHWWAVNYCWRKVRQPEGMKSRHASMNIVSNRGYYVRLRAIEPS
jgi:hypothetical protein